MFGVKVPLQSITLRIAAQCQQNRLFTLIECRLATVVAPAGYQARVRDGSALVVQHPSLAVRHVDPPPPDHILTCWHAHYVQLVFLSFNREFADFASDPL